MQPISPIVTQGPYMNFRLKKEMIDHLQNAIDNPPPQSETDATNALAGHILNANYIEDKDDLFFENVLNGVSEHLYYKDWKNYYNIHIEETSPPLIFELQQLWVNHQKQHEFNPPHFHSGLYSFVVFMKIPTHWKEQHALPASVNSNDPVTSDFQFFVGQGDGRVQIIKYPLSPEDEGRMLFFPAWLMHQVLPFYGTEEERVTISGNIGIRQEEENKNIDALELTLEKMEKEARSIRTMIKKEKERQDNGSER